MIGPMGFPSPLPPLPPFPAAAGAGGLGAGGEGEGGFGLAAAAAALELVLVGAAAEDAEDAAEDAEDALVAPAPPAGAGAGAEGLLAPMPAGGGGGGAAEAPPDAPAAVAVTVVVGDAGGAAAAENATPVAAEEGGAMIALAGSEKPMAVTSVPPPIGIAGLPVPEPAPWLTFVLLPDPEPPAALEPPDGAGATTVVVGAGFAAAAAVKSALPIEPSEGALAPRPPAAAVALAIGMAAVEPRPGIVKDCIGHRHAQLHAPLLSTVPVPPTMLPFEPIGKPPMPPVPAVSVVVDGGGATFAGGAEKAAEPVDMDAAEGICGVVSCLFGFGFKGCGFGCREDVGRKKREALRVDVRHCRLAVVQLPTRLLQLL